LSFGQKKILDDFSYDFNKGDRIGIVGRNGVGKSTFINILTGDQTIDAGIIEAGDTVVFGKYDQMGIRFLDENQSVLDFVKQRVESISGTSIAESPQEAMKMLNQFEFPRQRWSERYVHGVAYCETSLCYDTVCTHYEHIHTSTTTLECQCFRAARGVGFSCWLSSQRYATLILHLPFIYPRA
jgi:GTPase SAR1 family protein